MSASREGHLNCVKELLEKGALVNAQSKVSAVWGCMVDPICYKWHDEEGTVFDVWKVNGVMLCGYDSVQWCVKPLPLQDHILL